jgi:hypothetical protein
VLLDIAQKVIVKIAPTFLPFPAQNHQSMNWMKLSNIGIYSAGVLAIIDTFLGKYIPNHSLIFFIVGGVAILLFLVSELMKFTNKIRIKKGAAMYKRINIIHRLALGFLGFSLGLYIVNDAFLKKKIPLEIIGYLVFLSLGFYVGFHVCLGEIKRIKRIESSRG